MTAAIPLRRGPPPAPIVSRATIPPKPAAAPKPPLPSLRDGDIHLGEIDSGGPLGLSLAQLLEGRLLIQGASGAGKSWTLRRLLEQTEGKIQQIVIDPEGEFQSYAEASRLTVVHGDVLDDVGLRRTAERVRAHRLSVVLDLSDCEREDQMRAVAGFLQALVDAPREHWHSCLVAIDEAHLFAPYGGDVAAASIRKAAIGAVVNLMSRGRKRGLAGVLATQRLARMAKSVVSEAHNFLIGLNTLDLDIRRAAETIGWDASRAFDRLPLLVPGEFAIVGPAFSRSPAVAKIGGIRSEHRGSTPRPAAPPRVTADEAALLIEIDTLSAASQADEAARGENRLDPSVKALRAFIRDPAAAAALTIFAGLKPLYPNGARVDAIAAALGLIPEVCGPALFLLDRNGMIEFAGEGSERTVRIECGQAHLLELR